MNDNYKTKLFSIILPKMSAYVKSYDGESKRIFFLFEEDELS